MSWDQSRLKVVYPPGNKVDYKGVMHPKIQKMDEQYYKQNVFVRFLIRWFWNWRFDRICEDNLTDLRAPEVWEPVRKAVLKRDNYTCQNQRCQKTGVALHVHHIKPVDHGGGNDMRNLISLCEPCHSLLHPWIKKQKKKSWY